MTKIHEGQQWRLLNLKETNPEHDLFDSLISEFTEISGFPILYYIKLMSTQLDSIYGEDPNEEFTIGYSTNLIYKPTEELSILDSFGISSDETLQYMMIPKSLFSSTVKSDYLNDYDTETNLLPKPGDCIRTLWNNKLYEIVEIGSEQKIFQGKKMIWEFITRPYRHSEESTSANDLLNDTVSNIDFPEINLTTTVAELSAYGDNDTIEEQSNDIADIDTSFYGYDT